MVERVYMTVDLDELDLIAFREYGISSQATEVLFDKNYRIADNPIQMPAGVRVELVTQHPPMLRTLIRLWD